MACWQSPVQLGSVVPLKVTCTMFAKCCYKVVGIFEFDHRKKPQACWSTRHNLNWTGIATSADLCSQAHSWFVSIPFKLIFNVEVRLCRHAQDSAGCSQVFFHLGYDLPPFQIFVVHTDEVKNSTTVKRRMLHPLTHDILDSIPLPSNFSSIELIWNQKKTSNLMRKEPVMDGPDWRCSLSLHAASKILEYVRWSGYIRILQQLESATWKSSFENTSTSVVQVQLIWLVSFHFSSSGGYDWYLLINESFLDNKDLHFIRDKWHWMTITRCPDDIHEPFTTV